MFSVPAIGEQWRRRKSRAARCNLLHARSFPRGLSRRLQLYQNQPCQILVFKKRLYTTHPYADCSLELFVGVFLVGFLLFFPIGQILVKCMHTSPGQPTSSCITGPVSTEKINLWFSKIITLYLRAELRFPLKTCSVPLWPQTSAQVISRFWNCASKLPTASTLFFLLFFFNHFQNFRNSNWQVLQFLCIRYFGFWDRLDSHFGAEFLAGTIWTIQGLPMALRAPIAFKGVNGLGWLPILVYILTLL